jgi:hypothetical protein
LEELAVLAGVEETLVKPVALVVLASLLEAPWGRPMILREASCASDARFAGLSGSGDTRKPTRGTCGIDAGSALPPLREASAF